ncbi:HR1 repeat-containing protein [Venustampulla echinocandica]|uniref:HR1 repeat-containing protein n=1 Tax=Venustampulla echinocandica TaxID=2656787 RepID=A0A370TI09_9HELO|nr:HR1 repeat-containing protein [Venustampulla echinocandica]RDL34990.1 HR1 repeat-containing protein [Venustampulla echinocandica]
MVGPPGILSSSATPTQKSVYSQHSSSHGSNNTITKANSDRDGLQPSAAGNGLRALSSSNASFAPRGSSLNPSPAAPGSFSSNLRSQMAPSRTGSNQDVTYTMANLERLDEDDSLLPLQAISTLRESLNREMKIKEGSENMLEALNTKKAKQTKEQRQRVEAELNSSNQKIKELKNQISELQRPRLPSTPTKSRIDALFQSNGLRSPPSAAKSIESDFDEPTESPTYTLAEILQALEIEGLTPDYYVGHANNLVELFKRYPKLKYDLVWSVFGLRMQVMLVSQSREVVAAGYRMIRYAISDSNSLQKIRGLNTDYLVVLSLVKKSNADVEREQALKFVRAFLDVKDGVHEVSRAVVRTIAAVAEHLEDRLRAICIETLAEIMVRDPSLLVASGGLRALADALGEGTYEASESLTAAFLFLLDSPRRRKYLRSGYELEVLFTPFTDSLFAHERILKQNSRSIAYALRSWPGLMTLSMYNFRAVRSLISSLMLPNPTIRETIIDLLYSLLRIKSPFWATSFLAGRRLTTYGRVATLKTTGSKPAPEEESYDKGFVDHYTALLLAVLITSDMLPGLLQVTREADNSTLKRKTTLLIGEVLKLASRLLPSTWSSDLQLLPELFAAASQFGSEERFDATGTVYQISSVSRTLYRSAPNGIGTLANAGNNSNDNLAGLEDTPKSHPNTTLDETTFRQLLVETQVLSSTNPAKWNWDIILKIIEGPLLNGKRLDEAIKASKFVKRIMSFYRPFKYKFGEIRNTRINQKYVKVGCALIHTLLQTSEGVKYLADNKLLRQIAECLAQCDPTSGLTAQSPVFSKERLAETLCSGYFAMLGTMSGDVRGLQLLDRWRMINMMYHIIELKQRPDLIKLLLSNFDYSLQGHPRVLLSKALTAGSKEIRIHATNVLRRYARGTRFNGAATQGVGDSKWAIQLLVTQLYDPEVEVSATAIKILEEACNRKNYLEYIVECRPALDHLGEIGAPLLLRFLSTSIGYHYLDGLDYISNEMDDWFLGRNDAYVGVIEASLARAFAEMPDDHPHRLSVYEESFEMDTDNDPHVPPHFYRELTRTKEGCKLLRDKGHFDEFASTIRDYGMLSDDAELILKVKGCLWAVGNVGSMALGAPFLDESDVVENIVKIAESHEIMSLRGTAFFVLGLISRSVHGLEILSEYGWDSNTTIMGDSLGLCIPQDLNKLFSYEPWVHAKVSDIFMKGDQRIAITAAKTDDDPVNKRILELITDLGNTVLQKRAMAELSQIKLKKTPNFKQSALFKKVMTLLEAHHFRLTVRRFVIELFDRNVLRRIVFEEDSDNEGMDSDDNSESEVRTERQRSLSDVPRSRA